MKIIVASHGKYAHGIVNAAKRLAVVDSALYEICAYEDCRTINELFDEVLDENNEEITIIHSVKNKLAYAKGVEKALIEIISKIKESSLF